MEKHCLLIDNEIQDTSAEKIIRLGKEKQLTINITQFNVGNSQLTEVLEDNKINIEKVISYYKTHFKKTHFDLIAFDWSFDDPDVDGVKLIQQFRTNNLLRRTNIVLYSGELPDTVKSYFSDYKKDDNSFKENWPKIKTLIDVPILGFFDRTHYEEKVVETLVNMAKHINIEQDLLRKLKENSQQVFNNVNPKFEGKTFGDIAHIIENDVQFGHQFTSEFIDQAIALLFHLNPKD
jgi:hypothetical protein